MQTVNAIETNVNATVVELPNMLGSNTETLTMIALRHLVPSPYNQRKGTRTESTVQAFADNIRAVGLLQNLVVHAVKKRAKKAQTYGVDAGETRRLALLLNAENGFIDLDFPVPCKVITEAEAILASVSENDLRRPPHPADQFNAYKALADEGRSPDFIASVFKVTPRTVAGHLKLASVSPKLFELFANDEMDLDQIQVLAITDDHERQEAAWFGAKNAWDRAAHSLRAVLKAEKLTFHDRLVKFVTVAAYEAAGGVVERDLFAEQDEGFIIDRDLLVRLFEEKIAAVAATTKAEGWSWVETRSKFEYGDRKDFCELQGVPLSLTEEQTQQCEAIQRRIDEIDEILNAAEDADEGEEGFLDEDAFCTLDTERDEKYAALESFSERDCAYTPEQMAVSGVIIFIDHASKLSIQRGLVRAEDRGEAREMMQASGVSIPARMNKKTRGVHSEKLIANLTAHRTAAVQCEMVQNPEVALATIVHKLALEFFYSVAGYQDSSPVEICGRSARFGMDMAAPGISNDARYMALNSARAKCQANMPKEPNELYGWLLTQPQTVLLNILAVCTAMSLNSVSRSEVASSIAPVAVALKMDLASYWKPTAESYFSHVSKDRIVTIVTNTVSREEGARLAKMKKGEAAQAAEKMLDGKGWLPEFMTLEDAPQIKKYGVVHDSYDDEGDESEYDDSVPVVQSDVEGATSNAAGSLSSEAKAADAWHFPKSSDFENVGPDSMQSVVDERQSNSEETVTRIWPFQVPNGTALNTSLNAA